MPPPAPDSSLAPTLVNALGMAQAAAIGLYALVQALLVAFAGHRWLVLGRRRRGPLPSPPPAPAEWPPVTVQLPIYNERLVAERLVDAVAAFDYPRERLEIQVLDDSTDETRAIVAAAVARHAARGVDIRHMARASRDGYKAGALAAGLERARGELLAVFDADFVPGPDFLRRAVPYFADPRIGMVQARWGHLNRDRSALTRAQAVMLDAHFLLEHASRMARALFFNFNGTAGVWRRRCIADAGGWSHDTLTEDLDLSYRAQLAGWRFAVVPDLVAAAELPADVAALRSQQHRWAKGSIQTARKLLPRLLAAPLPARIKLEAALHLTGNAAYPLLLGLGLLLAPVLAGEPRGPAWAAWALQAGVAVLGIVPVTLYLAAGQRAAGRPWGAAARDVAAALVLGAGLSLHNARAVFEGLGREVGDWERTPKSGDGGRRGAGPAYRARRRGTGRAELALAGYFAALALWSAAGGQWRPLPFVVLLAAGLGAVGWASRRAPSAARA